MKSTIDCVKTGENLKKLFFKCGLSVDKVASLLGVTKTAVYNWVSGNKMPSIDHLVELADLLGCSVDEMIVRKDVRG